MNQIVANVLITTAFYGLAGISFSIIYSTARFFNFAHGAFIALAPYVAYSVGSTWGLSPILALAVGVLASVILAVALDVTIFRALRRDPDFATKALIASLGLYTAIQGLISLTFGASSIAMSPDVAMSWTVLGARITWIQAIAATFAFTAILVTWLFLHRTLIGTQIRAIGNDRELSLVYGCNVNLIGAIAIAYGTSLAGITGWLVASDTALTPTMGFSVLLGGVVAMIIGGVGNTVGIALAALLIASLEHATGWWISSAWERLIVFAVLLLFLLLRPRGIAGLKLRRGGI